MNSLKFEAVYISVVIDIQLLSLIYFCNSTLKALYTERKVLLRSQTRVDLLIKKIDILQY